MGFLYDLVKGVMSVYVVSIFYLSVLPIWLRKSLSRKASRNEHGDREGNGEEASIST